MGYREQTSLRWSPALGQPGGSRCSRFSIQVSEYLPDHRRVINAGGQINGTAAFGANSSLLEGLLLAVSGYTRH